MPQEKERPNCIDKTIEDFYVDSNTGCKSKRKIKSLKCKSDCSLSSNQAQLKTLNQTPFGYLIGTNKQTLRSLRQINEATKRKSSCCRASKVKKRKMKLFCADGSTIMTDVSIIKRCSCSNECMSEINENNKQRILRHSYNVQA